MLLQFLLLFRESPFEFFVVLLKVGLLLAFLPQPLRCHLHPVDLRRDLLVEFAQPPLALGSTQRLYSQSLLEFDHLGLPLNLLALAVSPPLLALLSLGYLEPRPTFGVLQFFLPFR